MAWRNVESVPVLLKGCWFPMAKSRGTSKRIHLTKREKQNLDRFGCAFRTRPGIFFVESRTRKV
jgi:hypothetical protein